MNQEQLFQLAKTELHCHLDGSLPLSTIRKLAKLANISIPSEDKELRNFVSVPGKVDSLMTYLKTFDFIRPLLQTKEALKQAAYDLAVEVSKENVLYIEIRFAPELSMDKGLSAKEVVEAVLEGLKAAQNDVGIIAKGIVCGMKQSDARLNQAIFSEVKELADQGLVGFDFAGNEVDYPTEILADSIKKTQSIGLPMTFHAGECGCVANVAYALQLGIKRIGHGTALASSLDTIAELVRQEATVEMCLTSNLQTGATPSLEDFHYKVLYQSGAKITINTDNRTVSNTTLTREYGLFVQHFNTTFDDFYRFNCNAIEASFASRDEKRDLLSRLKQSYYPE
ncbi:TPA: adenosine deaminase [Streptococcus suis]|nr:adenosine deaminase [Streptococcus suis]